MTILYKLFLFLFAFSIVTEASPESKTADWTVLIYINGKNDLQDFVNDNLNQLETVGSTDRVQFIVQYSTLIDSPVKRSRMLRDFNPLMVTTRPIEILGEQDMGDFKTLTHFLHWGAEKYPAKHFMIVVWDHGTGWHADIDPPVTDEISHDEKTNHWITTKELGYVMEDFHRFTGKRADIFSTDACLMASIEVAYEMASHVDFYLGSQDLEPKTGWPYHHIARKLVSAPLMDARELSKLVTDEYVKYTTSGLEVEKHEAVYSVLETKHLPEFRKALVKASSDLLSLSKAELIEVQKQGLAALHFNIEDYIDVGDFLFETFKHPKLAKSESLFKLQDAYRKLIVHNVASPGFAKATGSSLWVPQNKRQLDFFIDKYQELKFSKETRWENVLREMF